MLVQPQLAFVRLALSFLCPLRVRLGCSGVPSSPLPPGAVAALGSGSTGPSLLPPVLVLPALGLLHGLLVHAR